MRAALAGIAALALAACSSPGEDACTLAFERIARIAPPPGDDGLTGYTIVSPVLPGGRRAVVAMERAEAALLLYDERGRFIDTLGGVGAGPNEYRRPQLVLPYRGDSIIVLDRQNGRVTVLDSAYRVARSFPMTFPAFLGAALTDGSLALAHGTGVPGYRVARFGPDGESLDEQPWSFRSFRGGESRTPLLQVGAGADGRWWTLSLDQRFEFRRYDSRDSLHTAWRFPSDLLPPYEGYPVTSPEDPPEAWVDAGYVDARDRLWAFAAIADSQWAEGLGPRTVSEGQEYWPTADVHALRDGLVIVADAASGQVLRTWRLDSVPGHPIEPGVLLTGTEDDDGWFHPELRRPVPSPACGLD
jgi:hypothetical protein